MFESRKVRIRARVFQAAGTSLHSLSNHLSLVFNGHFGDNESAMTSMGGTTHLSFLERLRDRTDTRSWVQFHEYYGELLFSYARRLGASHERAEDVVQEVEMYVFKAIGRFRLHARKGSFRAYLRSAVVHALARKGGMERNREAVLDPQTLDALAKTDPLHDAAWQRDEYLHRIRWAMRYIAKEFEPVTLEAFRLHVLAALPVGRTAEVLGLSKDSVYQAKSRILKRLRERVALMDWDL